MTRSTVTPRNSALTNQTERSAKRLVKQQKQLEKEIISEVTAKITPNAGKMVKLSDIKKIEPLTDTQALFFEAWKTAPDDNIGFVLSGSAGTGKTYIAMFLALTEIMTPGSTFKKIIIIRSAVQTRDIGFLKGTDTEKSAIYELPYIDICADLTKNKFAYEKLKETGKLEFMCTSFLRGISFNDAIIIVDEAQCNSWHEQKTICTRVGYNSRLIIVGDLAQNDLIKTKNDVSGFKEFLQVSRKMAEFRTFTFTPDDIVRSGFCRSFILTCESLGL